MREKPISLEIEESSTLKQLVALSEEIKNLFLNLMSVDKRTIRKEKEKAYFKGRLQLYSTLYKKCREKFLKVKKETKDNSSYYKEPIPFEELIKDFNWEKTVNYSQPFKKEEEKVLVFEDDDEEQITTIDDNFIEEEEVDYRKEFNKIFEKNMKKYIDRKDPEVIGDVLVLTIVEFLEKYKEYSTSDCLKRVYGELKREQSSKEVSKIVQDRVGVETKEEPLSSITESTGELISEFSLKINTRLKFVFHDGSEKIGVVTNCKGEDSIIVESGKIKYPIKRSMILEIFPVEEKVMKVEEVSNNELLVFKQLSKEKKLEIVQNYYNDGIKKCGDIVSKIKLDYTINHYDDVYNVFTKINK